MTSKNIQQYYTLKCLIRDLFSNCFILLAFLPKILKESFFSKCTHTILQLYTNAQLTGFSFLEIVLLKFLIKYGRNLFSIYIYVKLAEFLSDVKNRRIRPKVYY